MTNCLIPRRDLSFFLYEMLDINALTAHPRYSGHDLTVFNAVLDTAERIASDYFSPHAALVDQHEPEFESGSAKIIPEVKDALDRFAEAGLLGVTFDEALGGLQLPVTVGQACQALFSAANISTTAYPFLTMSAANLLSKFGSDWHKSQFVIPMIKGRFFGTMCLSEPNVGSSLSDISTRANPTDGDHYSIIGSKMWVSGGDHNLSENIIHLVLAKIPGGPDGVKGISLFAVPKKRVNEDGSLGASNNVVLVGLNHKMGYRGTVNALLNFGESGESRGYLIGEPHKGLAYMFYMMNEARIGVGLGATALGYAGFRASLAYAKERYQGRHPDVKNPRSNPVAISEHADVKRLLLSQKVAVEGSLALVLYCAHLVDLLKLTSSPTERTDLNLLLDILTPVAKAWPSEFCLEANKHAIQVLGGYGYTRDYPVERLYRDNRLNSIHEGTHGIQGLDLLGRKVVMQNGMAFEVLKSSIKETIRSAQQADLLKSFAVDLGQALDRVANTTLKLVAAQSRDMRIALADATLYLDTLGHLVIGWMWLKQALIVSRADAKVGTPDALFYDGKQAACRFFFRRELPKVHMQADLLERLDDTTVSTAAESL